MSNLVQESSEGQKGEEEVLLDPRFSMLCLNGGGGQHQCASCGFRQPRSGASATATPMKRRSPTPFQDPNSSSKRLFLDPQQNQNQKQNQNQGFSKIDLPIPFGPSAQATVTPPPLPLRRTVSDPNPSPGPDNISGSPNQVGPTTRDTPDSKRLRRMKERLREMNEWWNELMKEEDDDAKKSGRCNELGEEGEESVGVERVGDSLEIHLKCPCGKAFEILLNGTSCFYKLL